MIEDYDRTPRTFHIFRIRKKKRELKTLRKPLLRGKVQVDLQQVCGYTMNGVKR